MKVLNKVIVYTFFIASLVLGLLAAFVLESSHGWFLVLLGVELHILDLL
jgi:hypothetical protein